MADERDSDAIHTPFSAFHARPIDGRGREGRFLGRVRQELISDLGGSPSGAERMLIDRVAGMMLRLALFDERMAAGDALSSDEHRSYTSINSAMSAPCGLWG